MTEHKFLPLGGGVQIAVSQNHTFGTDAILLAHFAAPKKNDLAVDLGTGCGIIPLLWRRDGRTKMTYGIDIADEAINLAKISAEKNGFASQLRFEKADLKNPFAVLKKGGYSLVTCNPPYKASGTGIISKTAADVTARHETACTLENVIETAAKLLCFGGRFVLCQRPERIGEIISLMVANRLEPKTMRLVCKTASEAPWLVLIEGRLGGGKGMKVLNNLTLYDEAGNFSKEMRAIYASYLVQ